MQLSLAHVTLLDTGVLALVLVLGALLGFALAVAWLDGGLSLQRLRAVVRRDRGRN